MEEARSQAAHFQNLLEEQRQRAADAENRLEEARSQAAHFQNLLEEQRQRAADVERRLAEKTIHDEALLDEAKDQLARCEGRGLEKAAGSKRLEEQVQALGEALDAAKRELGQEQTTRRAI